MRWTDRDKQRIAAMLRDKLTASEIGAYFGVSRNAIIGIVGRTPELSKIGYRHRAKSKPAKKDSSSKPKRRPSVRLLVQNLVHKKASRSKDKPFVDPTVTADLEPRRITLMELDWRDCRWIVEGTGERALFCGLPKLPGSSYCECHYARSIASVQSVLEAAE